MIKDLHYSSDLEKAVLGACLLEANIFGIVYGLMKEEMFYHKRHQLAFNAMKTMYGKGIPIDLLTVNDYIQRVMGLNKIEHDNTAYFLTVLTNNVTGSTHIEYHCRCLADMWRDRELISITSGGLKDGANGLQSAINIEKRLQALYEGQTVDDFVDMDTLMVQMYQHRDRMIKSGGIGISTGLKVLDHRQGGFQNGDFIVIGARPSVGKSALMSQMALYQAHNGNRPGIISLEMNNASIAGRLASVDTQTDFNYFYKGLQIDERQSDAVHQRINSVTSQLPIFVSDKTGVNIIDIKAKAAKLKREKGITILYIDYLQLVDALNKNNRNREQEVSEMSRGCKLLAKELNIPVVALAQLSREVTKRTGNNRYPQLPDIRETGSIEQDADVVMFLHKDFLSGHEINELGASTQNEADLIIAKWRNQEANFRVPLEWIGRRMQFVERDNSTYRSAAPTNDVPNGFIRMPYKVNDEEDPF